MREYTFNSAVADRVYEMLTANYEVEVLKTYHDSEDVPLGTRTRNAINWKAEVFVSVHANASGADWSAASGVETFWYNGAGPTKSEVLAANVQTALIRRTGMVNRGVKRDNFQVIRDTSHADIPAILCECGFMTNRADLARLQSGSYRELCAQAIVDGIAATFPLTKKGAKYKMTPADANAIITKYLQPAYAAAKSPAERQEIGRLADEMRKASGQQPQN
jgi:N-acetylmuramoyl-L-alanine amidase